MEDDILNEVSKKNEDLDKKLDIDKIKLVNVKGEINASYAKKIAELDSEKYCNLINNVTSKAKDNIQNVNLNDKKNLENQIKALEKAKSKRGLLRKIKEFFNGTRKRENTLIGIINQLIWHNKWHNKILFCIIPVSLYTTLFVV